MATYSRRTKLSHYTLLSVVATLAATLAPIAGTNIVSNKSTIARNRVIESVQAQDESFQSFVTKVTRFRRRAKASTLLPEFSAPIGNVSAVLGRDVRLVCTVEHLGQYQVAWLKEESNTIISIDTNIIITNYRIFLIPDEEGRKWVLHIKDVQESDRGSYQCQVNTKPMRATSGHLEVVVPPTIIESQTSQVAETVEHSNVSIQCKANGHPRASITWRRDDGGPIKLNGRFVQEESSEHSIPVTSVQQQSVATETGSQESSMILSQLNDVKSDKLSLYDVDRSMAGIYVCTASNGIPGDASKRIPLYVKFAPKTSVLKERIPVSLGDQLELECLIEAFPKPNSYWSKRSTAHSLQISPLATLATPSGEFGRWTQALPAPTSTLANLPTPSALSPSKLRQLSLQAHENPSALSGKLMTATNSSAGSSIETVDGRNDSDNDDGADNDPHAGDKAGKHNYQQSHQSRPNSLRPKARHHHHQQQRQQQQQQQSSVTSEQYSQTDQVQHPHNRLELIRRERNWRSLSPDGTDQAPRAVQGERSPSKGESRAYVTVRQTPVNLYTYKLTLTIANVQAEDYGQYACIATNSMGTSETHVMVTRLDQTGERRRQEFRPVDDQAEYQRDSLETRPLNQQQQATGVRKTGVRMTYDENYLQAIKLRQSSMIGSSRLQQQQQKLKSRQLKEGSSGRSYKMPRAYCLPLMAALTLIVSAAMAF